MVINTGSFNLNWLQGKKTYIVAFAVVVQAAIGVYLGDYTTQTAITMVLSALGLGALRSGVTAEAAKPVAVVAGGPISASKVVYPSKMVGLVDDSYKDYPTPPSMITANPPWAVGPVVAVPIPEVLDHA
jgi:hypothetical protein